MILVLVIVVFFSNPIAEKIDHKTILLEAPAGTEEHACLVQGKLMTDELMKDATIRDAQFACFSADPSRAHS